MHTTHWVGSADIPSLADLANSFEVVRTMRFAPISKDALIGLVAAMLVPVVPLALTMMTLEERVKKLFGVLENRYEGSHDAISHRGRISMALHGPIMINLLRLASDPS